MGAFNGYRKGLLMEIIGISAFVVAIVIGFKFLSLGTELLSSFISNDTLKGISPYMSFLVIFFPTIFMIRKVGWLMRKALRMTFLGTLDGALGALLGGFTVMFVMSVFIWLLSKTPITFPESWMKENHFYAYVEVFAPSVISKILDWLPFGGNWVEYLDLIKEKFEYAKPLLNAQ